LALGPRSRAGLSLRFPIGRWYVRRPESDDRECCHSPKMPRAGSGRYRRRWRRKVPSEAERRRAEFFIKLNAIRSVGGTLVVAANAVGATDSDLFTGQQIARRFLPDHARDPGEVAPPTQILDPFLVLRKADNTRHDDVAVKVIRLGKRRAALLQENGSLLYP